MAADDTDVLIVGGGPAGAASARLLATWGHDVRVVTRSSALGALAESIPPSCRKLLDTLAVTGAVDAAGFVHATGNTVWWGGRPYVTAFESGTHGWQVERARLDALLLGLAADAGARVEMDATVREVGAGTGVGERVARYDGMAGPRMVHARWVLDCSGRSGVLARHGWRHADPGQRTLALIASWERADGWGLDDDSHTLVESYEGGWAWSVPASRERRCFAFMVDPALTGLGGRPALASLYDDEVRKTARFRTLLEGARLTTTPWACDASAYGARRVADAGALLVGDAASFVDPLSSFGVKKALASAWLAAIVVHTCLTESRMQAPALQLYESRERLMYESLQRRSAEISLAAADGHAHDFWLERSSSETATAAAEPDIAVLRQDADVLGAFDALRRAASIELRPDSKSSRADMPVVRGNRITLEPHLISPAFPDGIRYVRDVDLVKLADMAGEYSQVPDLFDAYNRTAPPVPLPDFLGALSLLLGKGVLRFA